MWQCEIRRFGSLPTFMCEEVWPGVGMVTKPRLHMHTHHLGILPLVPRILATDQIDVRIYVRTRNYLHTTSSTRFFLKHRLSMVVPSYEGTAERRNSNLLQFSDFFRPKSRIASQKPLSTRRPRKKVFEWPFLILDLIS